MDLIHELAKVRWSTAFRTRGNDHATLIGLIVDWWVQNGSGYYALESAPTVGEMRNGLKDGHACDAILVQNNVSKYLLEVEGTRYTETLWKMKKYFTSAQKDLETLEVGIFVGYATKASGRGKKRQVTPLPEEHWIKTAKEVSRNCDDKEIIIIGLEKEWEPTEVGPFSRSPYYQCSPYQVWAVSVRGNTVTKRILAPLTATGL
jgi:hypothetical protein